MTSSTDATRRAHDPSGDTPHPTDRHLLRAFPGATLPSAVRDEVAAGAVAGVTLFRGHGNIESLPQLRALIGELQAARPPGTQPLLVGVDQEGGQFLALGQDSTPFAGNLALGAVDDLALTRRVGAAIGAEAAVVGVNVVYAPVCDLATEPRNPSLGLRTFGDDPTMVGAHAAAFVRGLHDAGVAATLKHLPGLGAVVEDSHHTLGVVPGDAATVRERDIAVFRAALAANPDLVMAGHVAVPALTGRRDLPASVAREVMTDLLRTELGFTGVAITDALDMHPVNADGVGQVLDAVAALRAGVDLLLGPADIPATDRIRDGLRLARRRGLLDMAELARSAARIDELRRRLAGHDARAVPAGAQGVVGSDAHRALAVELARRAITRLRDDAGLLPLPTTGRVVVVEPRPRNLTPADTSVEVSPTLGAAVAAACRRTGRTLDVEVVVIPDPPNADDIAAVRARVHDAHRVVLATTAAAIDPGQAELVAAVVATRVPTIAVVQRSPADIAVLGSVPTVVVAYGQHRPSSDAVADVLVGAATAVGRLPVAVPA